jgi:two-component system response regulator protein GraR
LKDLLLSKDSIQKGDKIIYLSKTEMIILEMLIQKQNQIVVFELTFLK